MSNITKIIDRVRKLLALAEGAGSEHEAAAAAGRATALIAEYQLSEAQLRVDDEALPPEPIDKAARLEPDEPEAGRKRVAWRELIACAVASDLGIRVWWNYKLQNGRNYADLRGFGRESAIQTWRYTCQYLWREIEAMAEGQKPTNSWQGVRAFRNAYRVGCAQRIAERLYLARQEREAPAKDGDECPHTRRKNGDTECVDCGLCQLDPPVHANELALAIIERDKAEVEAEYKEYSKDWKGSMSSIGSTSSYSGYEAGREAGDRVKLTGGGKGLPAGQGRIEGNN